MTDNSLAVYKEYDQRTAECLPVLPDGFTGTYLDYARQVALQAVEQIKAANAGNLTEQAIVNSVVDFIAREWRQQANAKYYRARS